VKGKHYKGSEAEVVMAQGTSYIELICRTHGDSWFSACFLVPDGKVKADWIHVTPMTKTDARLKFESVPEEYSKLFGAPVVA
jgi:hypothetical protein